MHNAFIHKRIPFYFLGLIILCIILFIADIILGNRIIPIRDIYHSIIGHANDSTYLILHNFRIPKAIAALMVGIALGISGLLSQTYFRNPLAGPDVLGISSGASLGVAILVLLFQQIVPQYIFSTLGSWVIIIAACAGATLSMLIITTLATKVKDNTTLLVIGLMLGAIYSSLITVIQYLSNESQLKSFIVWGFGSIRHLNYTHLSLMLPFLLLGIVLSLSSIKRLNALLAGEKFAQTLGINILLSRNIIFLTIIILAGTITAFCGPIAFIAITVPHLSRIIFRTSNHYVLIPACMLIGSIMMLLSDILSQLPGLPIVLPINALTSLMGIPLLIAILLKRNALL